MKKSIGISILALAVAAPFTLAAQEEEDAASSFIYASYFTCTNSMFEAVDAEVGKHLAPVYDAAVKDGALGGWGWLAHHTGGHWNRLFYHVSDSIEGALKAQRVMAERTADLPDDAFSKACNAHEDYIWETEAGNGVMGERGSVSLSVYHVCDINREQRADELVKSVFAPFYDKAIDDGKIKSWGWNSHVVGGKYRKLATMSGDSFEALLKARGEILEAVYADGENKEAWEFSEICHSHSDYMWNIQHEGRP